METKFQLTGLKETLDALNEFSEQFGDKNAKSKVLIPAVKMAMQPVLSAAKERARSDESHLLENSLVITGRRPSSKDRKSQYVTTTDSVVAYVITKPIPRAVKKKFHAQYHAEGNSISNKKSYKKAAKKFYENRGIFYDARAVANEFGTARRPAKPFLRGALENNTKDVVELLKITLNQKMREYALKNYNKTKKG
jgi:hypothetical protein